MLAISSGSTVTLWDRHHSTISTYQPNPQVTSCLISDLSWNDGTSIATCATSNGNVNIAITPVNEILNTSSEALAFSSAYKLPATANSINPPSISFGGKSRYLSVSSGNDISIFDNKRNGQVVRLFSLPPTESSSKNYCSKACIAGNLVAAASSDNADGALYLFRLKESGMPPLRLFAHKTQRVGCASLCFEPNSNQNAAVGMMNGSINIWDVSQGSLNCSIDTTLISAGEVCPIIDVCNSPLNSRLLASCSSRQLLFHDATTAKSLSTISMTENGAVCTSLSLDNSGVQCAVGTSTGEVLLYDLRKSSACMEKLCVSEHHPVTCVRFQRLAQSPARSSTASKEGKIAELSTQHKIKPCSNDSKCSLGVGGKQAKGVTQPACLKGQDLQTGNNASNCLLSVVGAAMQTQNFHDTQATGAAQPACSKGQHTASCSEALASVTSKLALDPTQTSQIRSNEDKGLGIVENLLSSLLDSDPSHPTPSRGKGLSGEESDDSSLCNFNLEGDLVVHTNSSSDKENESFPNNFEKTGTEGKTSDGTKPLCMVCDKYYKSLKHAAIPCLPTNQRTTAKRLDALHKEVREMRFELSDRIDTLKNDVIGHLEGQSTNLTTMFKQQVDLVAKLMEENKELNKEIERLRRF